MPVPTRSLDNGVIGLLSAFGVVDVVSHRSVDWASATFLGARHEIRVQLNAGNAILDRIGAVLASAEMTLPGHVLADLILASHSEDDGRLLLDIEALTLIDA